MSARWCWLVRWEPRNKIQMRIATTSDNETNFDGVHRISRWLYATCMLDGLSLDQLRAFIAAADTGSFSAAGRQLLRAQSAVSELISRLEGEVGVPLFSRSGRYPTLTPQGTALLTDARTIVAEVDFMRARAKGMSAGIEPELSVVIDAMFPINAIATAAQEFRGRFPVTPLRLFVEALGNSVQPLLDKRASLGIVGPLPVGLPELSIERLKAIPMVMVAAAGHPLASHAEPIPRSALVKHTQLVLTDRSPLTEGKDTLVLSQVTWRLADLFVKRSFLLAGLGWGGMPLHAVEIDLRRGDLVKLEIEDLSAEQLLRPMSAAYPPAAPPGLAGRWLIERLKQTGDD